MNTEGKNLSDNTDPSDTCTLESRNRRKGPDRRKFADPNYKGPERRSFGRRRMSDEIEALFERLGRILCRHRFKALAFVLVVVAFFSAMITRITVDTSSEALLHDDDPILLEYNQFRDRFGVSDLIIIAMEPDEVFSEGFVAWLHSFHEALEEEVPHISDVTSLINARNTYGSGDELIVEDLLVDWQKKSVDWQGLRRRVLANPFYVNNIVSADGRTAAVVLETAASAAETATEEEILADFEDQEPLDIQSEALESEHGSRQYLSEKQNYEAVNAVRNVVDRFRRPDIKMAMSGGPFILEAFNRSTMQDLMRCLSISIGAIIFFLLILFRRLSGVVLPLVIIGASVLSTLGLMAFFNVPIKITTTILPAFLVAVGVGDAVHVLAIFYRQHRQGCSREEAIVFSLGHSGMAIVMTTLTTAAGLLSFGFAELSAIADMGIFAAAGVLMALFYSIVLLPALLMIMPIRRQKRSDATSKGMDRFLAAFADFSVAHPFKILAAAALIAVTATYYTAQLKFSDHVVSYFPNSMIVKQDLITIDRELKGVITLEVELDTGRENGLYDPEFLNAIETFSEEMKQYSDEEIYVGTVFSINDIVKEINQALHGNDRAYYTIPQERELIAQELFLFENSGTGDLEKVADSRLSIARVTIKTPWVDSVVFERFQRQVKAQADDHFKGTARVTVTGGMALMARTIPAAIRSMTRSYMLAFVVITVMMMVLVENVKLGLISMIPNLLPIITVMGVMGMAGVPLDMTTLMIGSIALGLVVDDTVHFMYNFRRYYEIRGDAYQSIRETLLGAGRALLITSLVLSFGFFADMFATLTHIQRFGFFTGVTILVALLADFVVAPALMIVVTGQTSRVTDLQSHRTSEVQKVRR
jgi:hydrophobe/amphiphile efflux-3 (HAE3) family protein